MFSWRKMLFLVHVFLLFGNVESPDPTKHQSKEVVDPDEIFLLSNSTLGDNGDTTVPFGVYQSAKVVNGPLSDTFAIQFSGGNSSYMDLDNTNGDFDGVDAFTWAFYIRPDNTLPGERIIMTYNGTETSSGCELIQDGSHLVLRFEGYEIDNSTGIRNTTGTSVSNYIIIDDDTIDLSDRADQWLFIVVTFSAYNNFAAVAEVVSGSDNSYKHKFDTESEIFVFAHATGNIRFGNSFNGNMPFLGSISCIQFKQMSLLKSSVVGLEPKCDPNSWVDHSILGRVKPAPIPTTTSTTSTTSTSSTTSTTSTSSTTSTTSSPSTTSTTQTSSATSLSTISVTSMTSTYSTTTFMSTASATSANLTSPLSSATSTIITASTTPTMSTLTTTATSRKFAVTSSAISTNRATAVTASTNTSANFAEIQLSQYSYEIIERCQQFTLRSNDVTYSRDSDILRSAWVADLKACTEQCLQDNNCETFVISPSYSNGFTCYIGINTNITKTESGAKFYST